MDPMIRDKTGLAFLIKQTRFHRLFTTMHQFTDWSRVMSAWRGSVIYLSFARTVLAPLQFRKKKLNSLFLSQFVCRVCWTTKVWAKFLVGPVIKSQKLFSANPVLHLPRHDPTPRVDFHFRKDIVSASELGDACISAYCFSLCLLHWLKRGKGMYTVDVAFQTFVRYLSDLSSLREPHFKDQSNIEKVTCYQIKVLNRIIIKKRVFNKTPENGHVSHQKKSDRANCHLCERHERQLLTLVRPSCHFRPEQCPSAVLANLCFR